MVKFIISKESHSVGYHPVGNKNIVIPKKKWSGGVMDW
jgi:hypothetical protein